MTARDAVLEHRFQHPGETEQDVWHRVADHWSTTPDEYDAFRHMMEKRLAFPNTPAIANAGREINMGSACFVLPIEDSMEGIMETLKNAALVQKSGGGTGFDFSELRAAGELVKSTGRGAPGPTSFLEMYSNAIHHVTQGAGMRPGANMGIIRCDHPDALKFIESKRHEGHITNFNISVACTDEFMERVLAGHPEPLWEAIVDGAHRNGEPGVIFVDTVNRRALHPELIAATNPCGEVPLLPYEACVLGSVNLAEHVTKKGEINYSKLDDTVRCLTTMLDNIIDKQSYPIALIERTHKRYRKIGVGVMGFADMLIHLGIDYNTPLAVWTARNVMRFIQSVSYDQSAVLGSKRGFYPGWDPGMPPRRNLMCQVIAPTGTISRLAGCSFGIEPNYASAYDSFILGGVYREEHPLAEHEHFVEAHEVSPSQHLAVQAAFQEYTDQAVSKTLNLPSTTTVDEVEKIYLEAYTLGCKGVTVLRDKSRNDVVIDPSCTTGVCTL